MRRILIAILCALTACLAGCNDASTGEPVGSTDSNQPSTVPIPANASVSLSVSSAPIAQAANGEAGLTAFTGRVRPATAGAEVLLERRTPNGWVKVGEAVQGRRGHFSGTYPAKVRESLRARSRPGGATSMLASNVHRARQWSLAFNEDFTGRRLNAETWYVRHQPMQGSRMCAQPADDRVRVGGGVATLSVRRFDQRQTETCPKGRFHNAMIGTTVNHRFLYGYFAARVKFQDAPGMHGAFWLQGPAQTGAEIDVVEYFGARPEKSVRYKQQRVGTLIHYTNASGEVLTHRRLGDELPTARILGKEKTPGNSFHVYAVHWTPTKYTFYLDGQRMFSTDQPHVSQSPEEIILSLLTSDWELPRLITTDSVMQVDWVRVWQEK